MSPALLELDPLGWMAQLATVLFRPTGMVLFLPIFGSEVVPIRLRFALALALAVAMLPVVAPLATPPADAVGWVVLAVRELAVGLAFGLAAKAIFAGVEGASGIVSGQAGFSLASMVDPMTGEQVFAPAMFQNMLAIALFLAADLHHVFILAVRSSYEIFPPALGMPDLSGLGEATGVLGTRLFAVAVELAAPALLVTFAIDLLLGLVGRAMTQVPILLVGYPLKMAAGMVALALLATTTGSAINWIGRTLASDGLAILSGLAGS